MLRVDLRTIQPGAAAVSMEGSLAADDPVFQGLDLVLEGPVTVRGTVYAANRETYIWEGSIAVEVGGECRRCLTRVRSSFEAHIRGIFSSDPETADDPGVYCLPEAATAIDLREVVREEVGLAVPSFPLCREDCAGLCPHCGTDLNQGTCVCAGVLEPH